MPPSSPGSVSQQGAAGRAGVALADCRVEGRARPDLRDRGRAAAAVRRQPADVARRHPHPGVAGRARAAPWPGRRPRDPAAEPRPARAQPVRLPALQRRAVRDRAAGARGHRAGARGRGGGGGHRRRLSRNGGVDRANEDAGRGPGCVHRREPRLPRHRRARQRQQGARDLLGHDQPARARRASRHAIHDRQPPARHRGAPANPRRLSSPEFAPRPRRRWPSTSASSSTSCAIATSICWGSG